PEGIFLTKSVSGFTCMRFGWVGSFQLMGGGDRACRGYHPGDNSDSNYVVHWRISFEECKARCIASRPVCSGFEFTTGRCEVWTKSIEAVSSGVLPGYSCFKRLQMLPPLLL
ncbi:ASPM, partial [Symbiodinium microadriaticum]